MIANNYREQSVIRVINRLSRFVIVVQADWTLISSRRYIYIYITGDEDLGIFGRESFASFLGRIRRIGGWRMEEGWIDTAYKILRKERGVA